MAARVAGSAGAGIRPVWRGVGGCARFAPGGGEVGGGGQVGARWAVGRSLGGGGDELLHHADEAVMGCGGGARDGAPSPAPHMLCGGDSGAGQGAGRAGGCTGRRPEGTRRRGRWATRQRSMCIRATTMRRLRRARVSGGRLLVRASQLVSIAGAVASATAVRARCSWLVAVCVCARIVTIMEGHGA